MQTSIKNHLLLFVLGAVFASLGNYFHVISQTLDYPIANTFFMEWFKQPYWSPLLFGVATWLIGISHIQMDRKIGPKLTPKRPKSFLVCTLGVLLFTLIYCISGYLPWEAGGLTDIILALCFLAIWFFWDRSWQGFALAMLTAIFGCITEIIIVKNEAFYYYPSVSNLINIPSWLPCLYASASITVGNFSRNLFNKY